MRRFTTTISIRTQEVINYTVNVDATSVKQAAKKLRGLHKQNKLIPLINSIVDNRGRYHNMYISEIDRVNSGDMIISTDLGGENFELSLKDTTPDLY